MPKRTLDITVLLEQRNLATRPLMTQYKKDDERIQRTIRKTLVYHS